MRQLNWFFLHPSSLPTGSCPPSWGSRAFLTDSARARAAPHRHPRLAVLAFFPSSSTASTWSVAMSPIRLARAKGSRGGVCVSRSLGSLAPVHDQLRRARMKTIREFYLSAAILAAKSDRRCNVVIDGARSHNGAIVPGIPPLPSGTGLATRARTCALWQ